MRRLTYVEFEYAEREVLRDANHALRAVMPILWPGPEDAENVERWTNGIVNRGEGISPERIQRVIPIYIAGRDLANALSKPEYWLVKFDEEHPQESPDFGDPEDPTSAAHMAGVIAESRRMMVPMLDRGAKLLELAYATAMGTI
jgi:hypothetical protein